MRLLTDRLHGKKRSSVRFLIVGGVGTAMQYGLYVVFVRILELLGLTTHFWVTIAFGLSFGIEMCFNYLATCYYTFSSRPSWGNALGFFGARVPNYLIQNGLLWLFLWVGMSERWSGLWAIFFAGLVNYILLNFIFKKK